MLKDALAEVACKEERIRAIRPERREEAQMGNTDVLGFVHDGEVERWILALGQRKRQGSEQVGLRGAGIFV